MGLGINWTALLAPLIVKVVEALIAAFIKWVETQEPEKALSMLEGLVDNVAMFNESENKITAAKQIRDWTLLQRKAAV